MIGDGVGAALLPGGGIAVPREALADLLLLLRDANREGRLTPELRALVEVVVAAATRAAGRRSGAAWANPNRETAAQGTRGRAVVVGLPQTPEGSEPAVSHGMSTTEAAGVLGVSSERARQLAASGALPAVRLSGRWLLDPVALAAYRREDGKR